MSDAATSETNGQKDGLRERLIIPRARDSRMGEKIKNEASQSHLYIPGSIPKTSPNFTPPRSESFPVPFYSTGPKQIVPNPLVQGATEDLQDAELFEKDYIQNVRRRPYKSTAKRWLINGGGIGGIMLLPFGPVGLLAGIIIGMIVGLCLGLLVDLVKLKRKHGVAEKQKI